MYRIAICDDEARDIEELERRLEAYGKKYEKALVVTSYQSPDMFVTDVEAGRQFDVVFLDMEMPRMSGLEVMRELKELQFQAPVIIFSAYLKYSPEAIEYQVFRYLTKDGLKDFDAYLAAAIRKVDSEREEDYFIQTKRRQVRINCREILYCRKESKMSLIMMKSGEIVRERKPLHKLLEELRGKSDAFIPIERGYIVNLRYVREVRKNLLYLEQGETLPVGYTYVKEVKMALNQYWRKRL